MQPLNNRNLSGATWIKTTTVIPFLVVSTVILAILFAMGEDISAASSTEGQTGDPTYFRYTALNGYFHQAESNADPETYDPKVTNFGLISRTYDSDSSLDKGHEHTDWQRFAHHVSKLNEDAPQNTSFRVLYLGRHGQGYHNVAILYYGGDAWDCYYSLLDGDPEPGSNIKWKDAHLTLLGIDQAKNMSKFWRSQIQEQKTPAPQSYYVSPLDRACRTAELTFNQLSSEGILPASAPFKPTVKELLREGIGIHSCDQRSSRTYIANHYDYYTIEPSLTEEDELFDHDLRESDSAHTARMIKLFDDVFGSDDNTYISMTAHGGTISAILRAVGHRVYQLPVGSAIPVLVRVERLEGKREMVHVDPWMPKPNCLDDPLKVNQEGYKNFQEFVKDIEKQYVEEARERAA